MDNEEHKSLSICVKCTIIQRVLELLDSLDSNTHVEKVSLNHVYYGSVITKKLTLFNVSPVVTDFVVAIDKEMSESVNMGKSLAMTLNCYEPSEKEVMCLDALFDVTPKKVKALQFSILVCLS